MYKLVDSASFFKNEEMQVTLLDLQHPKDGLEKSAADSSITNFVSTLSPKPGKCYLHINAMGAGEYYGANRNGDYFPEDNLKLYYKTFETSPAHLFRHHVNKDPSIAQGVVILSIYNERMHRVELIVEANKEAVADIEAKIAKGEYPKTSMATKTPYDVCSICGNKAHSRAEYCKHLTTELGRIYSDGRKVMALNVGPLRFFDISYVTVPADPTSSILNKIAGEGSDVISSAEMAEQEGIFDIEKKAEFKKVSELVKLVEGDVVNSSPILNSILNKTQDLPIDLAKDLAPFNTMEVLVTLAKKGISPSVRFLSELIGIKFLGDGAQGVGDFVHNALEENQEEDVAVPEISTQGAESNPFLESSLEKYAYASSLLPKYAEPRITSYNGVGYFGQGPHVSSNTEYYNKPPSPTVGEILKSNAGLLLEIGAVALLCKHIISKEMEKHARNNAKINLVKQAQDYSTASVMSRSTIKPFGNETQQDQARNNLTVNRLASKIVARALRGKSEAAANALKIGNLVFGD